MSDSQAHHQAGSPTASDYHVELTGGGAVIGTFPAHAIRLGEITIEGPNTLVLSYDAHFKLVVSGDSERYAVADARVKRMQGERGHNRYTLEIVDIDDYDLISHHRVLERLPEAPPVFSGEPQRINESKSWPHLRESVLMLNLAVAQIESSMEDGERSVGELTQTFFTLSETLKVVYKEIESLFGEGDEERKLDVMQRMSMVQGSVNKAIIAFQFYDKLKQRLQHISWSLSDMARLVSDLERVDDDKEWQELKDKIKRSYSIEEELELFEAILRGEDIQAAIRRIHSEREAKALAGDADIELF